MITLSLNIINMVCVRWIYGMVSMLRVKSNLDVTSRHLPARRMCTLLRQIMLCYFFRTQL